MRIYNTTITRIIRLKLLRLLPLSELVYKQPGSGLHLYRLLKTRMYTIQGKKKGHSWCPIQTAMSCMNFFRRFYWTTAEARRSLLGNVLHHSPQPITSGVCDQPLLHPLFPDSDEVIPDRPLAPYRRASDPLDGERSRRRTSEIRAGISLGPALRRAALFLSQRGGEDSRSAHCLASAAHNSTHAASLALFPSSPLALSLTRALLLAPWRLTPPPACE